MLKNPLSEKLENFECFIYKEIFKKIFGTSCRFFKQ